MTSQHELDEELTFWKALAEERGKVIRALHEFNYWHESTVARGEVIEGLERSVELWRERCLACEANADSVSDLTMRARATRSVAVPRLVLRRLRSTAGSIRRQLRRGPS